MRKKITLLAALFVVVFGLPALATTKVTLCHAAGLDGTTHYVELTVGYPAAFGPAGHFYENGTPRAGHEQDYLGPCEQTTTTSQPTTTTIGTTTTTERTSTTTTTSGESTTTTVAPTSTTSVPSPTTTITAPSTSAPSAPPAELPFTGAANVIPMALAGLLLIAVGWVAVKAQA